jgi:putative ABC transport system permease protein
VKYFLLIWAALRRKPVQGLFSLFSVAVAFTLFGLMMGLNASFARIVEIARQDRINVYARFGGLIPLSLREQVLRLNNVTQVGSVAFLSGYHRDPKDSVVVFLIDHDELRQVWTELPLTRQQLDQLEGTRAGVFISQSLAERFGQRRGDKLPILTRRISRSDGSKLWIFDVLGVTRDIPSQPAGYIAGNFDYFDTARPLSNRGKVGTFDVLVKDPGRITETSRAIDRLFANSRTPTRSIPEKAAYQSSTEYGLDISYVTRAIAAVGLFMILFLTGNGIALSVREREPEFAMLKAIGFSDFAVMALVFAEAAIPCVTGAATGVAFAKYLALLFPLIIPSGLGIPLPYISTSVVVSALFVAAVIACVSAVAPALRAKRLDVATALAGR